MCRRRNLHQAVWRFDVVFGIVDEHVLYGVWVRNENSSNAIEEVVSGYTTIFFDESES